MKQFFKKAILKLLSLRINRKKNNGIRINLSADTYAIRLFFSKFKANLDKGILKSKGDANVYMDIGANIGWYSLCAIKAGYTSVVSIEANPDTFSSLRNNIKINKFDSKITALNLAISNEQKILGITDSASSDQNTILSSDPDAIKVFSVTVDELITHLSINEKIYLKIDVEGAEHLVIEGATASLSKGIISGISIEVVEKNKEYVMKKMLEHGFEEVSKHTNKDCTNYIFKLTANRH